MGKKKKIRARGKIPISRNFQKLKKDDKVSIINEKSERSNFPKRLQGKSGKIIDSRGKSYFIKIKENGKEKKFLIKPVHLKKIK